MPFFRTARSRSLQIHNRLTPCAYQFIGISLQEGADVFDLRTISRTLYLCMNFMQERFAAPDHETEINTLYYPSTVSPYMEDRPHPLMTFQNMCIIALADGQLHPSERQLLEQIASVMEISPEVSRDLIDRAHALDFIIPEDEEERYMELRWVVLMMLSDGRLTEAEYDGCQRFATLMQIDHTYLDEVIVFYRDKQAEHEKHLDIFQNLYIIAAADGTIDEAEHGLLSQVAESLGLGQQDIDQIQDAYEAGELQLIVPASEEDRYYSLKNLLYMMVVDGEIDEREMVLCEAFADACGMGRDQINEILAEYEELRENLAEERTSAAAHNLDVYLDAYNALKAIDRPVEQLADAMLFALRTQDFSRAISEKELQVRAFYTWLWLACVRTGTLQLESLHKLPLYLDLARTKGHFRDHLNHLIGIEHTYGSGKIMVNEMTLIEIQTSLERKLQRDATPNLY